MAEQTTVLTPAELVSAAAHDCAATPEVASLALGVAVTASPTVGAALLSVAASVGGV